MFILLHSTRRVKGLHEKSRAECKKFSHSASRFFPNFSTYFSPLFHPRFKVKLHRFSYPIPAKYNKDYASLPSSKSFNDFPFCVFHSFLPFAFRPMTIDAASEGLVNM